MTEKARRVAAYCRVSTADQDPEVQLREIRGYIERRGWSLDPKNIYTDRGISGSKDRRPALDQLLAAARKRHVDTIVCFTLCRFGRSLRHLVTTIDELGTLGVGFISLSQGIDTSTNSPAGTLTLQVLACVAQFERALTIDRVRSGLARAKAAGKRLGRRPTDIDLGYLRGRLANGESIRGIARSLGTSDTTLRRALGRAATKVTPAETQIRA